MILNTCRQNICEQSQDILYLMQPPDSLKHIWIMFGILHNAFFTDEDTNISRKTFMCVCVVSICVEDPVTGLGLLKRTLDPKRRITSHISVIFFRKRSESGKSISHPALRSATDFTISRNGPSKSMLNPISFLPPANEVAERLCFYSCL